MHELNITQNIVEIVSKRAGDAKVCRIKIEIGKLAAVAPDSIRFCFDVCTKGTPLEGALLEIDEIDGRERCNRCGAEIQVTMLSNTCTCGSRDLTYVAGQELLIKEMEVE